VYLTDGTTRAAEDGERFPLPLARVVSRSFPGERRYGPYMLGLLGDLAGLYRLPYDRAAFASRRRTTFTTMVAAMLPELIGDGTPVGLVVLAHSTPDGEPTWPACFLNNELPGEPLGFAVADQGPVAPFTALRIADAYVRAGDLRRAIVIILDQDTVLCDPALADRTVLPTGNRAVALVFDERGDLGELSVRVAASGSAGHLLADAGPAVQGSPGTAGWVDLAAGLEQRRSSGGQPIVVAGQDPVSGATGRCVVRLPPAGRRS
jgi:hypothetical protein